MRGEKTKLSLAPIFLRARITKMKLMKTHLPGHSSKKSAEQKEGPMIPLAAFIIFVSFLNSRAIPQNSLMQHHSFCHRVRWFLTKPVPFSGVACAVPQTRLCGSTRAEIRAERGREKKRIFRDGNKKLQRRGRRRMLFLSAEALLSRTS